MIRLLNNIARYNLIDTKYRQMAFWSPSDGAPISPYQPSFGTSGQKKVSGDNQRETTHEVCCLAAEFLAGLDRNIVSRINQFKPFQHIILKACCPNIYTVVGCLVVWSRSVVRSVDVSVVDLKVHSASSGRGMATKSSRGADIMRSKVDNSQPCLEQVNRCMAFWSWCCWSLGL